MTSQIFNARFSLGAAALEQNALRLDAIGKSSWRFLPRAAARCSMSAALDDDWLVLVAHDPLGLFADAGPWTLLRCNSKLSGFSKFALLSDGSLQLRAELPVIEEADLAGRIREICEGLESAFALYALSAPDCAIEQAAGPTDLKQLCTDAGWPFIERGPEKLLVELESPGCFRQAVMVRTARGVHLSCELASVGALDEESREAIAMFLLSASGVIRLARATIEDDVARLEVAFAGPPCASEISRALEVLTVGSSLCGEEIKTLQDKTIARHFLALRGRNAEIVV